MLCRLCPADVLGQILLEGSGDPCLHYPYCQVSNDPRTSVAKYCRESTHRYHMLKLNITVQPSCQILGEYLNKSKQHQENINICQEGKKAGKHHGRFIIIIQSLLNNGDRFQFLLLKGVG